MVATKKPLFSLTALEVASPSPLTLQATMSLRDAAKLLGNEGVLGAPVVDADGRCIGVLSSSDLVRWAIQRSGTATGGELRTCCYQETHRGLHGVETILCTLPIEKCPMQHDKRLADGQTVLECREPHALLVDWQIAHTESLPIEDVQHFMTSEPVIALTTTPIATLARQMIDAGVHRIVVVDDKRCPVGIVSAKDLVAAMANADN